MLLLIGRMKQNLYALFHETYISQHYFINIPFIVPEILVKYRMEKAFYKQGTCPRANYNTQGIHNANSSENIEQPSAVG
jgi:hypothetical protein